MTGAPPSRRNLTASSPVISTGTTPVHRGGRVTQREIADHLGLSLATISLALSDSPLVADSTRTKVYETAQEFGYVYNRSAASLRKQSSGIIGVCIHDITNPFFVELITAIEDEIGRHRCQILFNQHGESRERQANFISMMREHGVDGLILCPAPDTETQSVERIMAQGTPVVLVSRGLSDVGIDAALMDDQLAMDLAVSHLIEQGHQDIALLGGLPGTSTGDGRRAGYIAAHERAGLPVHDQMIFPCLPRRKDAVEATKLLMERDHRPSAIACLNDVMAFGAMATIRSFGMEPGVDIAITGIGDVPEAADWRPSLTTVSAATQDMGRRAASLLYERIADPSRPARMEVFNPTLIVRESSQVGRL